MARIVIVSQSEPSRTQLSRLLASSGYQVFRCCSSGSELRRALNDSEDCLVIMIGPVAGCKPDDLAWDYGKSIQLLLIAKPPALDDCESPEVFKMPMPVSGQSVLGAVEMLTQLHRMRMPRRTGESKETVEQAKKLLMQQQGLTEPEAHRALQQYAMNHGVKMADFAAQILKTAGRTEE